MKFYIPQILYEGHINILLYDEVLWPFVDCYKLPSIWTRTRLTLKMGSIDYLNFINSFLMNSDPMKRTCILLIDEVYVKASLLYQGGNWFGHAVKHPEKLAITILLLIIKYLLEVQNLYVELNLLQIFQLTSNCCHNVNQLLTQ